ncbi:MAG: helix-turn-helix domain-containing protein [Deltaproteobacteria bacterium]|nr:helix-turn-helix domain-containing protein [Deltaproteobacteria bacterium]
MSQHRYGFPDASGDRVSETPVAPHYQTFGAGPVGEPLPARKLRASRVATSTQADDADRLLDARAAAAFLGVAPRTLYKWAAQGRLPVVRLGRAVRFRVTALRLLVREHEEPAAMPLGGTVAQLVGVGTERAPPTRP